MKMPFKTGLLPMALAGVLAGSPAWAQEEVPEGPEVIEEVAGVPAGRIAGYFSDFLGGEEASQATVEGLRDGSISYLPPEDPEAGGEEPVDSGDVVEGEPASGMGYGNVFVTLALAEQLALASAAEAPEGELGLTPEESLNEVLFMRQSEGMGWGQIAREMDVNLGQVISGIRSGRPERMEVAAVEKAARGGAMRAEKAQRPDRAEKVAKVDRPERPLRPERPEKPARPEKPERPEKPARPERPGR